MVVTGLPDPVRSRAVLIGTSRFDKLSELPAVRNNLAGLAASLCDSHLWGLQPTHCVVVADPVTNADMLDPVTEAAGEATDTLLLYYAGHGLIDSRHGELHLALVGSDQERIYTAVSYNHVRDALLESRALRRIVVLDCCYSGRALGLMSGDLVSTVVNDASAEGTYIMAAAAENKTALAPPGEKYTAFTAELLATLRQGIPDRGELLELDAIFNQVRAVMREKSRPSPQKRDRNTAGQLTLVRNRAYGREPQRVTSQSSRLLGGRYKLDGVIGRGGMAEVYRARDIRLDRIVAVMALRDDLARDQIFQARFRRRAALAASLNHPSIVAVYDTGEDMVGPARVPYIVMEYVDGRTLRDLLQDDLRLPPERALEITGGVLLALDYIHRNGILHLDIKPGNVMLTRTGDVKVMDSGIARVSDAPDDLTQEGQVIGTAQYLSPEQARSERVDARSDLYSAGCLLYELLTGRPPFTGASPVAILYQHVRENPVPPSLVVDTEIPPRADSIVLKAMAKDPGDRYQSAAEMRFDIQNAMQNVPRDPEQHQAHRDASGTARPTLAVRFAVRSDVGILPNENGDSAYAGPHLLAVADGMGDHTGSVASAAVISAFAHLDYETLPDATLLFDALARAANDASEALNDIVVIDRSAFNGMKTTLTAMLVSPPMVALCHIGDSRAYLLRDAEFRQITRDHTLVQGLLDEGRISEDEAAVHPQRSVVLRVLDGSSEPEPDLSTFEARAGDRYMLCSDGLSDVLSDETLRETLIRCTDQDQAVAQLTEFAIRCGGPDNITCIVADVIDASTASGLPKLSPAIAGAASDYMDSATRRLMPRIRQAVLQEYKLRGKH